jgi:hypothetical protein
MSLDEGSTWKDVAILEDEVEAGVRIHYPTLIQVGNTLQVVYSRFYLVRRLIGSHGGSCSAPANASTRKLIACSAFVMLGKPKVPSIAPTMCVPCRARN